MKNIFNNADLIEDKFNSPNVFNQLANRYDFLNSLFSFGIHHRWRKVLVLKLKQYLEKSDSNNATVLDIATGTGDLLTPVAKLERVSLVIGLDPANKMLDRAKEKNKNFMNIEYLCANGQDIPLSENSVKVSTISFGLRNMPDYLKGLQEIQRVLVPGGALFLLEFSIPKNRFFKWFYLFYFRHIMPKVGAFFSGHDSAYSYLNKTVEDFPYGKEMVKILEDQGFILNSIQPLTLGICTLYVAYKK